ncbi:MAG: hypothetical protein ACI86S_000629 [Paracoccaceae bacterium]|jgi:hypothetical protein
MARPAIDPTVDLIAWMVALRADPSAYAGAAGVARLYRDLETWRIAQDDAPDMIDMGMHLVHPRRHGLHFLLGAAGHFKGYYGTDETRARWAGNNNWGAWLGLLSDNAEQALDRVFKWLDLFVEINGLTAAQPHPIVTDTRPFVRVLDLLRPMRTDPTARPGDGSLQALQAHLHAISADKGTRMDEFTQVLLSNISAMLDYRSRHTVLSVQDMFTGPLAGGGIDAQAQKIRPKGDRWQAYFGSVDQLYANWRGMHQSQGGTRSLIKG